MVSQLEKTTKSYSQEDWKRGYDSQPNEYDYQIENIEGEIPLELMGTLFRNGPGLLDIFGVPLAHPFDGDGMINKISFDQGKAHFQSRYVHTKEYIEEQKAEKMLYRGVFGSQKPGGLFSNIFDLRLKNIANTNIIYWGKKLLALWEGAEPYRLDPNSLETIGIDYLDGLLEPGKAFAAHPHIDPNCIMDQGQPCLVNFSVQPGPTTTLNLFEFNPEGKLLRRQSCQIKGFAFIHDFIITPNYAIFFQNPVKYNPLPFLFGLKGAGECIDFSADQPTKIIIIPRDPEQAKTGTKILETSCGFIFHHANAFEIDEDNLVVDSICYGKLSQINQGASYKEIDFESLAPGQLWRFQLNLNSQTVERELIEPRCCEFPSLHPEKVGRNYRYLFIGAAHQDKVNAPLQAILKIDLETKERKLVSFAPKGFVSEPIFVPKAKGNSEDDGYVFTVVYDASCHQSKVVILDGKSLDKLATLHLKHHIPYGLHGSWCPEVFS
jgi:all-trans-8'-apo-beta-carotenal 15,15'-oxygenase